jgi:prevent-host-death family protein
MERVGVRELKQNASAVLRRVEAGESLEVTARGRPVARLVPIAARDRIEQLIAEGRIIPASGGGHAMLAPPLPPTPGEPLPSEVLQQMRADER